MTILSKRRENCFLRRGKSVKKDIFHIFRNKKGKKWAHPVIPTFIFIRL